MTVEHTFRIARGSRGVTQRTGDLLVQIGPLKHIALGAHQVFVAHHIGPITLWHMLARCHNDPALDGRTLVGDTFNQRPKIGVKKHVSILGMINNVDNLLRKQTRVNRVTDIARAR